MEEIAVVHASQLVTMRGPERPRIGEEMSQLEIIEDGALIALGGTIEWVGRTDEMPRFSGETLDASGCAVLPGFIDAHTHAVFGGSRAAEFEMRSQGTSYQEIAAAGGGIQATVAATERLSMEELAEAGAKHIRWAIAGGTTALEIKSGYGLALREEEKLLRAAANAAEACGVTAVLTYLGAHAVPKGQDKDQFIASAIAISMPAIHGLEIACFFDMFCEPGYFEVPDCRALGSAAKKRGFKIKMHADQFSNSGGALLAAELGAVTADHLEHTDHYGIQALKEANVIPVLLPGSVYALGLTKYPAAREMIAEGLPVVLATDFNPGSSPTPSIPMIMSLACTQMRMSPAETLTATTINAAHSLGLGATHGSLEPGKRADFAIHDCADYRELAYYFGFNRARQVCRAGRRIGGSG